jgi:hypothetical protein
MVPDLFMICLLSNQLNVLSPVKKFPLVNVGPDGAKELFGWEGSNRFYDAAAASKQLNSQKPTIATEGAVECVVHEFEESQVGASKYNHTIERIEELLANSTEITSSTSSSFLSAPSSSSSSSSALAVMSTDISPQPLKRNRQNNISRTDTSNKGGVGNHKTTKNLSMSTRLKHISFHIVGPFLLTKQYDCL